MIEKTVVEIHIKITTKLIPNKPKLGNSNDVSKDFEANFLTHYHIFANDGTDILIYLRKKKCRNLVFKIVQFLSVLKKHVPQNSKDFFILSFS